MLPRFYCEGGCTLRRSRGGWSVDGLYGIPETREHRYMLMHIKDDQRVTDVGDDRGPRPVHDAAGPITQRAHDSMAQLVRQGLDTSLRSIQVWADLARQVDSTAVTSAYGPFEQLLATQREVVGDLVATQRQLVQQVLTPPPPLAAPPFPGRT